MVALLPLCLVLALQSGHAKALAEREPPAVLFFTHSAGFVHDVVKRPAPDALAPAEAIFTEMASGRYRVTCSQDVADLAPERLARFQAVLFMTTGELPVPEAQRGALLDWIARGGAFAGVHCATDTYYGFPPYHAMLGGTFSGHPWHQEIRVRVEDGRFAATAGLADGFAITDEIYQFPDFRRELSRVWLSLDPASVDISLGARADHDNALCWTRDWGEGRVFYTALGHREEVWRDARYQALLLGGIDWALHGPDLPARPPAGATVLFDGHDLGAWRGRSEAEPAGWRLVDGAMEVVPGAGALVTRASLGSGFYHVEFRVPSMPEASGQARGNSGVYLASRYEVQVLDSYGLVPALGDCGAIYGQHLPAVNACRAPERWQSYDIEFQAPRFDAAGAKTASARLSVWHNGIRIHDDVEVKEPTAGGEAKEVAAGPLLLQDHGNPVRYRSIWFVPR